MKPCPKECNNYRPCSFSLYRINLTHACWWTLKMWWLPSWFKTCGCNGNIIICLFIEFSSAFSMIKPDIQLSNMHQQEINPYVIHCQASVPDHHIDCISAYQAVCGIIKCCCHVVSCGRTGTVRQSVFAHEIEHFVNGFVTWENSRPLLPSCTSWTKVWKALFSSKKFSWHHTVGILIVFL